jgi:hypothetical protein
MSEVQHFPIRLAKSNPATALPGAQHTNVKPTKLFDLARARSTPPLYRPGKDLANPKQCLVKQPREFPYISHGKPTRANRRRRQPDYQLWSERGDS